MTILDPSFPLVAKPPRNGIVPVWMRVQNTAVVLQLSVVRVQLEAVPTSRLLTKIYPPHQLPPSRAPGSKNKARPGVR